MKTSDHFQKNISLLIIVLSTIGSSISLLAKQESGHEYDLKATFIYHFTKYVQWPDSDSDTFEVAVFGDSDIIPPLEEIARKRLVDNRKMTIKQYENVREIGTCHILFISASKKNELDAILQRIEKKHILTVGDGEEFAKRGVAINFVIVRGKTKLEMNRLAIERAGLNVSSQLQKLAIMVEEER